MRSARADWLAAHPYLEPIARFQRMVDEAAAQGPRRALEPPSWESYAGDEAAGVPLLHGASAPVEFPAAAAETLANLAERVAAGSLAGVIGRDCRELCAELRGSGEPRRAIEWIASRSSSDPTSAHPGLLRFLAWTAARRVLAPIVRGSASWRREERWGRGHCPTCGALPLSAQLVAGDAGRARYLACGCCGTRWRYRRIGCPSCGNEAQELLGVLELTGEARLRIDYCAACGGYLKTYTGEGDEELFLADWPTLHLDVIAVERGLRRVGASLYELPKDERRTEP